MRAATWAHRSSSPGLWPCSIPDFNFWFPEKEWRAHSAKKRREIERIHWPWLE